MRVLSRSAWCAICATGLWLHAAHAQDAQKSELEQTSREIELSKQEQAKLSKKRDAVSAELKELQSDSIVLTAQIRRMESQLAEKEAAYQSLQKQLHTKQTAMDTRKDDIAALLHAMIRMKRMPREMVIAQPQSLPDMLRTASALHVSYDGVEQDMQKLQQELTQLADLRKQTATARAGLQKEQTALNVKQDVLATTLKKQETALRSISRDYDKLEARIADLSRTSRSLSELIENIEKESAMFNAIGMPQPKPAPPSPAATTAPSTPASTGVASSFTAMKGRLPYPAAGTLLHRYGQRKGKVDTYQGQVLQTVPGAQITAPHSGKIVFTGKFMDYGNMAIIEHGGGYHTLIAGLSVVRASLGQQVVAGQPIGAMGDTTSARQLYLELRKDSKAIDPTPWMGNLSKAIATR